MWWVFSTNIRAWEDIACQDDERFAFLGRALGHMQQSRWMKMSMWSHHHEDGMVMSMASNFQASYRNCIGCGNFVIGSASLRFAFPSTLYVFFCCHAKSNSTIRICKIVRPSKLPPLSTIIGCLITVAQLSEHKIYHSLIIVSPSYDWLCAICSRFLIF